MPYGHGDLDTDLPKSNIDFKLIAYASEQHRRHGASRHAQ
jgi:hypothetical protein